MVFPRALLADQLLVGVSGVVVAHYLGPVPDHGWVHLRLQRAFLHKPARLSRRRFFLRRRFCSSGVIEQAPIGLLFDVSSSDAGACPGRESLPDLAALPLRRRQRC